MTTTGSKTPTFHTNYDYSDRGLLPEGESAPRADTELRSALLVHPKSEHMGS